MTTAPSVAYRIKRFGEVKSGVWEWSEWMLFQDSKLAGPWTNPDHIKIEPLYTADIIEAQSKALAEARATGAIVDIAAERERQKSVEGWTPEHDDEHETGQMASAAACYASPEDFKTKTVPREWSDDSRYMDAQSEPLGRVSVPSAWPWDGQWWKPKDRRRNLVKAAALIVAEIERLDRLTPTPENTNG